MMTQIGYAITALLLTGLLAGCGSSPPINYYVLTAQTASTPAGSSPSLGVGPIAIPEYLNRANLVTNRRGNTLSVAASDRWAEPLADGMQRVLAVNLAGLVNTQGIYLHPWHRQQAPDYGIRINLLALDAGDGEATLAAEWVVHRPENGDVVERRLSRLTRPLAGGTSEPAQVAATYSELLFDLSELIATAIASDRGGSAN